MNIQKLTLGLYQTNIYILSNDTEAVVIDPGYEPDIILDALEGKALKAILLTHGHFDHVGAVKELVAETGCKVYIHAADLSLPPMITAGQLYYTHTYAEGDTVCPIEGAALHVLHTPGHTPGSVCLLLGDQMFSGDTLFEGSCGRMDLPGGDQLQMHQSLNRLVSLQADYHVHPGHGGSTTLAAEKRYNPYMR
ncbi:MAG: MBL fold metallo-hydrolase [Oscillospiraceae bacterium]|nr:MBL fold metallo-hydrolase [Oscillospiraceae bacterium]